MYQYGINYQLIVYYATSVNSIMFNNTIDKYHAKAGYN